MPDRNPSFAEVVVPRIKSAKKRMRQAVTHTKVNRAQRSELRTARRTGQEYLLRRQLLYSRSTGEIVGPWVARFV